LICFQLRVHNPDMKHAIQTQYQKGFTLIELIITIIILGVLAAVVTPRIGTSADDTRRIQVKTIAEEVMGRIEAFRATSMLKGENNGQGYYPRNEADLITLFEDEIVPMHPCDTGLAPANRLAVATSWATIDPCSFLTGCTPKWTYRVASSGEPEYPKAAFYSYVTGDTADVCYYNPTGAAHSN
jgi:prepilin-type N-terminal cleavage/methylation domain-containing protein